MTYELDDKRYVGLYEEPAGSYAVDHSGTPADFLAMPWKRDTLQVQFGAEELDPNTSSMNLDDADELIHGPRSCTLSVGVTAHSHGLDLDGDVTAPTTSTWAMLRALQAILGGSVATTNPGAQTQVQAGTTTTAVTVTATHGSRFEAGGVIGCEVVSGSGVLELREVLSVAGDVVSVKQAFTAAPVTGSAVRGGVTVYMTNRPLTTLQALVEGRHGTDGASLRGLQGGLSLEAKPGELSTITLSLAGAGWNRMASAATVPTYSFSIAGAEPIRITESTVGSTSASCVPFSEMTVEPNISYEPLRTACADNTIGAMIRQDARPLVSGSFTVPYEDETWYDAWRASTQKALALQIGNVPGASILVTIPTVQIGVPQPVAASAGVAGVQVPWTSRRDQALSGTSELLRSALRFHFC